MAAVTHAARRLRIEGEAVGGGHPEGTQRGRCEAAVRAAIANEQPLEIIGHGSKRADRPAMATNAVLDMSA